MSEVYLTQAAKRAGEIAAAATEKTVLRERLTLMCCRAPAGFADWSYQQTLAFKEAALKAQGALKRANPSVEVLREAIGQMRSFWPDK